GEERQAFALEGERDDQRFLAADTGGGMAQHGGNFTGVGSPIAILLIPAIRSTAPRYHTVRTDVLPGGALPRASITGAILAAKRPESGECRIKALRAPLHRLDSGRDILRAPSPEPHAFYHRRWAVAVGHDRQTAQRRLIVAIGTA